MKIIFNFASGVTLKLKGDSKSSLKWGTSELFKGILVQRASLIYVLVGVHTNLTVVEGEHWAGSLNVRCDKLSRGTRPEDLVDLPLRAEQIFRWEEDAPVRALICLCDPTTAEDLIHSEEDLVRLWIAARDHILSL